MTEFFTVNVATLSLAIGLGAGTGIKPSNYNHVGGNYAGAAITTGFNNTLWGLQAGAELTEGSANAAFGLQALQHCKTGIQNIAINIHALLSLEDGIGNIAVGAGAMEYGTHFSGSVALGTYAGRDNRGSRNLFLGDRAGMLHTDGDDKLFIANNENEALIEGDFAERTAKINGALTVEKLFLKAFDAPAGHKSPGQVHEIRADEDFIYVCTAPDTWRRTSLEAW